MEYLINVIVGNGNRSPEIVFFFTDKALRKEGFYSMKDLEEL